MEIVRRRKSKHDMVTGPGHIGYDIFHKLIKLWGEILGGIRGHNSIS